MWIKFKAMLFKKTFSLTFCGCILLLFSLPLCVLIVGNSNSKQLLKINLSYILGLSPLTSSSIVALMTFLLWGFLFSLAIIPFVYWLKNNHRYWRLASLILLICVSLIICVITIISVANEGLKIMNAWMVFLGFIPFVIGITYEYYEWFLEFLQNKQQHFNRIKYSLNKENYISQEEQLLIAIDELKIRLQKLKKKLDCAHINSNIIHQNLKLKQIKSSSYNKEYYEDEVKE
ncbi:hypothetical protein [Spiroplasma endosymbiont of Asaphidion curtum]|uniref:hypothetical protein n=1 Tax=Spiroplasma endosymbiont of Asaphidion curtum TaxID=3066281 RepID=UPI00313EEFCA